VLELRKQFSKFELRVNSEYGEVYYKEFILVLQLATIKVTILFEYGSSQNKRRLILLLVKNAKIMGAKMNICQNR